MTTSPDYNYLHPDVHPYRPDGPLHALESVTKVVSATTCHAMANLQIKNLPDDVHSELRRRAGAEGMTLRDYVLQLILADQALPARYEWLARVRARRPVTPPEPTAMAVARDRAEHDAHLAERAAEQASLDYG